MSLGGSYCLFGTHLLVNCHVKMTFLYQKQVTFGTDVNIGHLRQLPKTLNQHLPYISTSFSSVKKFCVTNINLLKICLQAFEKNVAALTLLTNHKIFLTDAIKKNLRETNKNSSLAKKEIFPLLSKAQKRGMVTVVFITGLYTGNLLREQISAVLITKKTKK